MAVFHFHSKYRKTASLTLSSSTSQFFKIIIQGQQYDSLLLDKVLHILYTTIVPKCIQKQNSGISFSTLLTVIFHNLDP